MTQRLLPLLEAEATSDDSARVIKVGSIDGINRTSFEAYSYGPSKAGVHALTPLLALHLAPPQHHRQRLAPGGFRLGCSAPGLAAVATCGTPIWDAVGQRNPIGRVGTPADIAGVAIFLSSRAGAFTVGEVINCDGSVLPTRPRLRKSVRAVATAAATLDHYRVPYAR